MGSFIQTKESIDVMLYTRIRSIRFAYISEKLWVCHHGILAHGHCFTLPKLLQRFVHFYVRICSTAQSFRTDHKFNSGSCPGHLNHSVWHLSSANVAGRICLMRLPCFGWPAMTNGAKKAEGFIVPGHTSKWVTSCSSPELPQERTSFDWGLDHWENSLVWSCFGEDCSAIVTSEGNGSFKETALYLGFRKGGGLNAGFEMKGIKPGEVGAYYGSPKWRRGCGRGEIFHPRQQIEDQLRQQWYHSYCRVRIWIVHDHTFRGCSWWELSMRSAQTWDTSALP